MKPFRFALIGAGGMGAGHLATLRNHPRVDLRVICDTNEAVLDACDNPGAVLTTDFREALAVKGLDAAVIILPHYLYPEAVCLALENGLHVLKEKPFAMNLADARRMVASAKSANRIMMVAGQGKYHPGFQRAREIVDGGILGNVFLARGIITYRWGGAIGANWSWRGVKKQSGGVAVIDSGWHILDILHWLRGLPETVYCTLGRGEALPGQKYDVDDRAVLALDYADGGIASVVISFIAAPGNRQVILHGTDATLDIKNDEVRLHVGNEEDTQVTRFRPPADSLGPQFESFLRLIDTKADPMAGADEAYQVQRIIDAAYRSAKAKKPVKLAE